ncbi:Uncharacterized protein dnl_19940 [Desulfonema limicola]|uniref:Uncharacterized protein n=1 Tax=Desulfonema limicola TaxID=45656 RepID=A0A975B6J0_9BACT|nr:Uncharacterized protein dnl_19940 [Desulfonema limicola]
MNNRQINIFIVQAGYMCFIKFIDVFVTGSVWFEILILRSAKLKVWH